MVAFIKQLFSNLTTRLAAADDERSPVRQQLRVAVFGGVQLQDLRRQVGSPRRQVGAVVATCRDDNSARSQSARARCT